MKRINALRITAGLLAGTLAPEEDPQLQSALEALG